MLFGLACMSLLTLLSPVITNAGGYRALFAIRVLGGMASVCDGVLTYMQSKKTAEMLETLFAC